MPPKKQPPPTVPCPHTALHLEPSPFAPLAGFTRPSAFKRAAALSSSGNLSRDLRANKAKVENDAVRESRMFPAPLVLPHDDLNYFPEEKAQSFRSWHGSKGRNQVTGERRTIYVAGYPKVDVSVREMKEWFTPSIIGEGIENGARKKKAKTKTTESDEPDPTLEDQIPEPDINVITDCLRAFYHKMTIKSLPTPLKWTSWTTTSSCPKSKRIPALLPKFVALEHGAEITRVRVRSPAPDRTFAAQLNLNDILDAAMTILPPDAYALVLLVKHDLYESDDDDFCCGRAYGGSRVAVVQTARYNPLLDERNGIDRAHAWPASHCKDFVDRVYAVEDVVPIKATEMQIRLGVKGALREAVEATTYASSSSSFSSSSETTKGKRKYRGEGGGDGDVKALQNLWTTRVAQTTSHELGHCFGLAHCVYFACVMQSTASVAEDVRQPPYLCPICEEKIWWAVGIEMGGGVWAGEEEFVPSVEKKGDKGKDVGWRVAWDIGRLEELGEFCEKMGGREGGEMWRGLGAWAKNGAGELVQ
jgi:archaemetzincin